LPGTLSVGGPPDVVGTCKKDHKVGGYKRAKQDICSRNILLVGLCVNTAGAKRARNYGIVQVIALPWPLVTAHSETSLPSSPSSASGW